MRAVDQGIPALTSTVLVPVFISVFRNNNPPRFINTPYSTTISRDASPNSNVYQVSAVDNDNVIQTFYSEQFFIICVIKMFFFLNCIINVYFNVYCSNLEVSPMPCPESIRLVISSPLIQALGRFD